MAAIVAGGWVGAGRRRRGCGRGSHQKGGTTEEKKTSPLPRGASGRSARQRRRRAQASGSARRRRRPGENPSARQRRPRSQSGVRPRDAMLPQPTNAATGREHNGGRGEGGRPGSGRTPPPQRPRQCVGSGRPSRRSAAVPAAGPATHRRGTLPSRPAPPRRRRRGRGGRRRALRDTHRGGDRRRVEGGREPVRRRKVGGSGRARRAATGGEGRLADWGAGSWRVPQRGWVVMSRLGGWQRRARDTTSVWRRARRGRAGEWHATRGSKGVAISVCSGKYIN